MRFGGVRVSSDSTRSQHTTLIILQVVNHGEEHIRFNTFREEVRITYIDSVIGKQKSGVGCVYSI